MVIRRSRQVSKRETEKPSGVKVGKQPVARKKAAFKENIHQRRSHTLIQLKGRKPLLKRFHCET